MYKKAIWLIVIALVAAVGWYVKFYYPDSQFQLRNVFRYTASMPGEHFYSAPEKSCGIWYESLGDNGLETGRANNRVKKCFEKAYAICEAKNIFLVKDLGKEEKKIVYSLLRIIKKNDQNECIIQNYHEEQDLDADTDDLPLSFVNTCTVLKPFMADSCEPLYFTEEKNNQTK